MATLIAIMSVMTGNVLVSIAKHPIANDEWRGGQLALAAFPERLPRHAQATPAMLTSAMNRTVPDADRLDELFRRADDAGRSDVRALGAKLAEAPLLFDPTRSAWRRTALQAMAEPTDDEAALFETAALAGQTQSAPSLAMTPQQWNVAFVQAPLPSAAPAAPEMMAATPGAVAHQVAAIEEAPPPSKLENPIVAAPVLANAGRVAPLPPSRPKIVVARLAEPSPEAVAPAPRPTALAYATPELENKGAGVGDFFDNLLGRGDRVQLPTRRSGVAIYDITSATVRLPNGERLEAHSGLAFRRDNPRYIQEKNRGPTPPNVYNLAMREGRFHGAEAIRLLPLDRKRVFNRDGLLAHPYMYVGGGGRSQSNGCVVFKDYERFLRAFKAGEIARLIVVPNMAALPTYMSAL